MSLYARIGRVLYWGVWPGSWLYLHGSQRTRLLLKCGDELLVVNNWLGAGKWNLPGGGLHAKEDPKAGLLREVFEETGVSLEPAAVRLLATEPYKIHGFSYICHYFAATVAEKPVTRHQRLEIVEAAWVKQAAVSSRHHGPDVIRALQILDSTGRI